MDKQNKVFISRYKKSCLTKGLLDFKDIQPLVIFLLSDGSKLMNGQNFIIDDGGVCKFNLIFLISDVTYNIKLMFPDNNWYGHRYILLKYLGIKDKEIFGSLQHGWISQYLKKLYK